MSRRPILETELLRARHAYGQDVRSLAAGYAALAESLLSGASVPSYAAADALAALAIRATGHLRTVEALEMAKQAAEDDAR